MKVTDCSRQFAALLLILACALDAACAQERAAPLRYADDFAALGQVAAAGRMPIMLVFTRPDCSFCARAKKDHLEPLNANPAYADKIVLREIEAPNELIPLRDFNGAMTTHAEFARKYDVRAVPTVLMVDSKGAPLTDALVGLNLPDFYNLYLEQAIEAARLRLRPR
jgi:thioredoxin-related protein